jgi:hypothetical protein
MPIRTPWRCPTCGHYRAGTPQEQLDYFVDMSAGPDACWPFTGALNHQGYGAIQRYPDDWRNRRRAREVRAHRIAYALASGLTGPDADLALGDVAVMHLCDARYAPGDITYRRCCNPAHLVGGTLAENTLHMWEVGRQQTYTSAHRARGQAVGTSVLADAQVLELRRRFGAGATSAALAAEYGVSQAAAWKAIHGLTFGHLPDAQPHRGRGMGTRGGAGRDPARVPRGEGSRNAVLTDARVLAMRHRYAAGEAAVVLADEYGVTNTTAWNAIHGVTWAHVPDAQPTNTGRRGWPKGKPRGPRTPRPSA